MGQVSNGENHYKRDISSSYFELIITCNVKVNSHLLKSNDRKLGNKLYSYIRIIYLVLAPLIFANKFNQ